MKSYGKWNNKYEDVEAAVVSGVEAEEGARANPPAVSGVEAEKVARANPPAVSGVEAEEVSGVEAREIAPSAD